MYLFDVLTPCIVSGDNKVFVCLFVCSFVCLFVCLVIVAFECMLYNKHSDPSVVK